MTTETELSRLLIAAHRDGTSSVSPPDVEAIDREAGYRVQHSVMEALGEAAGMYKVAVGPDGSGLIAPIYRSGVGDSGKMTFPVDRIAGLEVEIGVVLARDLPPGSDRATVEGAIARYFLGVEVCATRYIAPAAAGTGAALADGMSAYGYVIDGEDWSRGADISGTEVVLSVAGTEIYRAAARHGFGGVLEAVVAYAKLPQPPYPLKAGTILTTGSMCGLVPTRATGEVVAAFGDRKVTLTLT